MAQEVINIGTAPNDGLGDPLRTAFTKTNNNFSQLFSTAGITGIANGTSNVQIPLANGNVTISSGNVSNVLIVTSAGVDVTGTLNSTGQATLSNLVVTGTTLSIGTIQSLTDVTAVDLNASANVTAASYLFGDGGYISNITAVSNLAVTMIANGSTVLTTTGSGANAAVTVGGVSNVAVFATSGEYINGVLSASGNVTGGNIRTSGVITATGNIVTGGLISATGNILTGGLISATGNITGGNVLTSSITNSANLSLTAGANSWTFTTTGNLTVPGSIILPSNSIITGSGASPAPSLTGFNSVNAVNLSASGNVQGNVLVVNYIQSDTSTFVVVEDGVSVHGDIDAIGDISATGRVQGNVLVVNYIQSDTSTFVVVEDGVSVHGDIDAIGDISATGNITGGNLSVGTGTVTVGNIVNFNANAVGNIGSASNYFNQVFAQSTTALYADLAEVYSADAEYSPGTVVSFGGDREVTRSVVPGDNRVAGVISEKPSYLMNSGLQAEHRAAVALTGRVPTLVIGPVAKGDMMVSAGNGWARASATPAMGTVIGKALTNFSGDSGIIEIVVGRL